jgi:hypothetical protein
LRRACSRRQKSAQATDVSGCSSSGWPTADTVNRKSRKAMTASTDNGRRSGGGNSSPPGLEQVAELFSGVMPEEMPPDEQLPPETRRLIAAMWATPQNHDGAGGAKSAEAIAEMKANAPKRPGGGPPGVSNLNEQSAMWPTPRSAENGNDSGSAKRQEQGPNPGLKTMASLWATPTGKAGEDSQTHRSGERTASCC